MHNLRLQDIRPCSNSEAKSALLELGYDAPDFCNYVMDDRYIVVFVWDTREVTNIIDLTKLDKATCTQQVECLLSVTPLQEDSKQPLTAGNLPDQLKALTLDVNACEYTVVRDTSAIKAHNAPDTAKILKGDEAVGIIYECDGIYVRSDAGFSKRYEAKCSIEDFHDWVVANSATLDKLLAKD